MSSFSQVCYCCCSLSVWSYSQPRNEHRSRYKLLCTNKDVAILIPGKSRVTRSIVVQPRAIDCHGAGLQVVSETHRSWDPLHCVLLFPYGTGGFHLVIPKEGKAKLVTAMEYYCWQLMQHGGLTPCCMAAGCSSSTLSTPVRKWNCSD